MIKVYRCWKHFTSNVMCIHKLEVFKNLWIDSEHIASDYSWSQLSDLGNGNVLNLIALLLHSFFVAKGKISCHPTSDVQCRFFQNLEFPYLATNYRFVIWSEKRRQNQLWLAKKRQTSNFNFFRGLSWIPVRLRLKRIPINITQLPFFIDLSDTQPLISFQDD